MVISTATGVGLGFSTEKVCVAPLPAGLSVASMGVKLNAKPGIWIKSRIKAANPPMNLVVAFCSGWVIIRLPLLKLFVRLQVIQPGLFSIRAFFCHAAQCIAVVEA